MKKNNQEPPVQKPKTKQRTDIHFKSLLVPIDFSDCSIKALDYAKSLARQFRAGIGLVHVLDYPATSGYIDTLAESDGKILAAARNTLNQFARKEIKRRTPIYSDVHFGRSYREICQTAEKNRADLIIMGTHGRRGLKRVLLGSTTEHVVRNAPCSVLVVRGREQNTPRKFEPKRILVPVDFSIGSNNAAKRALALAKRFGAKLQLVHVIQPYWPVGEYDYLDYGPLQYDLKIDAQKEIDSLAEKLASKVVTVEKTVGYGRPATEIVRAAEQLRSDLIVISTHGRTGLEHVLLGSTTEEVVRHASCPILVLREAKD